MREDKIQLGILRIDREHFCGPRTSEEFANERWKTQTTLGKAGKHLALGDQISPSSARPERGVLSWWARKPCLSDGWLLRGKRKGIKFAVGPWSLAATCR